VSDDRTTALAALFRAVADGEDATVSRMLRASPELARTAIAVGASRADSPRWFVREAARYIFSGDTALHFASATYRPKIVKQLLTLGADVRAKNRRRAEPLHAASAGAPGGRPWNPKRQAATIELLIDSGADPDCLAAGGVTPLHCAVRTRCAAAVGALLERGANPRARNDAGSTPLHLAVQTTGRGGSGTAEATAQQLAIVRLLVEHGARTSDRDGRGKTVTQQARGAAVPFIAQLAT
jgi:ankyrin repeat protein